MLGDLRVLDTGDELLLDCERVALQELFNMIRRFKLGPRRRAAQAHGRARAALADRAAVARRRRRRGPRPRRARPPRPAELGGAHGAAASPPTSASTCSATRPTRSASPRRWSRRARCAAGEDVAEVRARRDRPAALRRRPRRHRDPAGGRAQRARGLVQEGLLRRPGDGRAAVLPRQAEPPSARPAARRRRGARRRAAARRARGRPARHRSSSRRRTGRSRSRSCAARRRRATRSRSATAA